MSTARCLRLPICGSDPRGASATVVLVGLLAVIGLGSGCSSAPSTDSSTKVAKENAKAETIRSIEAVALALLPVDAWLGHRILRQRVRVEWPSGGESFDAVLQHRRGELALIGLGPMNLVGFRLALVEGGTPPADDPTSPGGPPADERDVAGPGTQRIEFENRSGRALPFSPAHILADVQRVFYPWLPEPWLPEPMSSEQGSPEPGRAAPADCPGGCERSGRPGAVAVWERQIEGRLVERRFGLPGRLEAGEVRIRYADWRGEPAFPGRVELENGWFGYRLTIDTLESTPIAAH
ncbi:DUF3261 domain-containing protein [Myxococcota bacterium]|nr:DUF3261 domain-containing protein [Myxococcota bacterium]